MSLNKESIEKWEYHYFNTIIYTLEQDVNKMLEGLKSKDKIKEDWDKIFKKSADTNSDFSRGAERIYFWLFNQLGTPNSTPIGADLLFETYNSFIHIDIKTCKKENASDYKNSIPIGQNQTSYPSNSFNSNLPTYYNRGNEKEKICLTYILSVVYNYKNLEIESIMLISIPNGELKNIYKNDIIKAGKNKGKSFRFKYQECNFNLIQDTPARYHYLFKNEK